MRDVTGDAAREPCARQGFAVVRPAAELSPEEAARAPWLFAERLLGERPRLVERQPIKAIPGGRSFASSAGPAPLHTDSQSFAGTPPAVQVMACVRPADRGGESVLVDAWALLDRIAASDPDLYRLLFEAPRRIPFVFGDVFGPTVALRGGAFVFTQAPVAPPGDPVAARLAPWIDAAPRIERAVSAGEILVVDNHRMLHGRRPFADPAREHVRLLVWTSPVGAAVAGAPGARGGGRALALRASRRRARGRAAGASAWARPSSMATGGALRWCWRCCGGCLRACSPPGSASPSPSSTG